jgi:DNA invertase Pin-like site-specific DNA recombinase
MDINDLHAKGVDFISLSDNIDLSTSTGKLHFHIIAAFAEFERSIIRERTRDGLARARAEGKQIRRPPMDHETAETIRELRRRGLSIRKIAEATGIARSTVQDAVRKTPSENPGKSTNEIPENLGVRERSDFRTH